ncbi:Uncharacterized protein BP5553_05623 [Venustampulla echinocandica]|uniref:Calpain catalytic domain-containing protein n=1 Tax=Venustampulla echinocandica TaxID=2656787 RepID=A0A370TRN3_9HELO|nr:Uncharacterized protein BP5553_05623 [Venustampulla echinocandica]RDL38190.1 Uncharacterized protein BP5553_05623 [Venustampulla echinocandica]
MSAYSSDSDNGRFRRHPPPPRMSEPKPRIKKQTLPPQETINQIWSKFSAPKFSKTTTILPPASHSSSNPSESDQAPPAGRANLLVSEGYERAAQECRTRVRKLVKECRRVNMRYRDPEFDIEWDLELGKGHCLNGLGQAEFRINQRRFATPTQVPPRSVKRVGRIFEKPTFLKEVSPADVQQGGLDNCWLLASVTALANMKDGIQRLCVDYDTKIGIYGFVFHRDGEWIISIIDDKLYLRSPDWDSPSTQRHLLEQTGREDPEKAYRKTYQTGSHSLFFARCRDQNETWLPLLEKAYAKAHGDYAALNGGWIGEGIEDLTGGVTTELLTSDILDEDELWENEILKVNKDFLFGCATGLVREVYGDRDGIVEGHAYVIMEARQLSTGERLVKLRNPWGKGKKGNWEGPWSDGSKEFTPESQQELGHKFATDSVFWISYEDMLRKYQHLDRTRLFVDSPDWRVTQKWVSVDVPWKSQFEARFTITLKKESPVVLALSQLDDRYFEALQGQYTFWLQFRLHGVDSAGEDDFIMRSHGNYLMERSVVAELKSLPAGTYTVFVMVTAERDLKKLTAEEVVKAESRSKVNNDKLAQVGKAYDLAHSKVTTYMDSNAKASKEKDKAKARTARIAARRKRWEKMHSTRDAMRKQDKKNKEKREQKESNDRAKAAAREGRIPIDKGAQANIRDVGLDKVDKAIQIGDMVSAPAKMDLPPATGSQLPKEREDSGLQTEGNAVSPSLESQGMPDTPESSTMPMFQHPPLVRLPSNHPAPGPGLPPQRHFDERPLQRHPAQGFAPYNRDQQYLPSEGESSASPVSDFEDGFSDEEPAVVARPIHDHGQPRREDGPKGYDSDYEDGIDPWNAVCIVGLRVYSKDKGLEVKVYEEDDKVVKNI